MDSFSNFLAKHNLGHDRKIGLGELLNRHGLSWYELYRRSGGSISKSSAYEWTVGEHLPSRASVPKIAAALGLPVAHVLGILAIRERHEHQPKVRRFCSNCHRAIYGNIAPNASVYEVRQTL